MNRPSYLRPALGAAFSALLLLPCSAIAQRGGGGVNWADSIKYTYPSSPRLAKLKAQHGTKKTHVGWIFGGIAADQGNNGNSVASNIVFDILITPR